jgi:hypothetical protein
METKGQHPSAEQGRFLGRINYHLGSQDIDGNAGQVFLYRNLCNPFNFRREKIYKKNCIPTLSIYFGYHRLPDKP